MGTCCWRTCPAARGTSRRKAETLVAARTAAARGWRLGRRHPRAARSAGLPPRQAAASGVGGLSTGLTLSPARRPSRPRHRPSAGHRCWDAAVPASGPDARHSAHATPGSPSGEPGPLRSHGVNPRTDPEPARPSPVPALAAVTGRVAGGLGSARASTVRANAAGRELSACRDCRDAAPSTGGRCRCRGRAVL
jgi:hypothetical protein